MNKFTGIIVFSLLISVFSFSQDYKLVWEDNFDQPLLNESQHWTIEVNGDGGGNNEMQYYRRENISIEKHPSGVNCLVISAKRENYGGKSVTSGRLVTRGNVSAKYGKIEARIKLPSTANGLWPAFWMMGEDYPTVGWPRCGEIDILEMGNSAGISQNKQDRYFNGACHWGETWTYYAKDNTAPYSLQDDFHLFTLIWDENTVNMYLDQDKYPSNQPYYSMSIAGADVPGNVSHYFHKPFSILFNLAVGGNFTGITGNSNINKITALPADGTPVKMYVDYVRIYQKGIAGEEFHGPSNVIDTENPTNFTVALGKVSPNSVELLLNADDNSGDLMYYINYGSSSVAVRGVSGTQKSYVVDGLYASTGYEFTVTAKDLSGNTAANSPISVSATTGKAFQMSTIDYENTGQDWTWLPFGNGTNGADLYSVTSNPAVSAVNPSLHCAKYKVNAGAMSWAGIYSDNVGSITFTPDNCKVKIQVYKPFISNFLLKFENGATTFEKAVANTKINQWEEIAFDFSDKIGQTITRMTLIPDNSSERNTERISYWDNISFSSNNPNELNEVPEAKLTTYPNPFKDGFKISSDIEIRQLTISNLTGQTINVTTMNCNETYVELTKLPAGIYFITLKFSNGKMQTQKITKL